MVILLDTDVVSALRRPDRADAKFRAWAAAAPLDGAWLSVITLFELERGVQRVERHDREQGALLRLWLDNEVVSRHETRMLPVDAAVARRAAALHVPDPRPYNDALIAATAIVHGLTLVTRNTRDFAGMGVALFNPWEAA